MNIDQVIAKLEAKEPITPEELASFKEVSSDKDATPYRRIQDALQILEETATGPRSELLDRLIRRIPVAEVAPKASEEDDLIPSAGGTGHADPPGEAGTPPPPPPAAAPANQKIDAADIADAKAAAAQAVEEERRENESTTSDIRPPEISEEEKQARIDEMERKQQEALEEKARREKEEAEAKAKADAEAKAKADAEEAEARKSQEAEQADAEKREKSERKKFLENALSRHGIDSKLRSRIEAKIKDGKTVAQLKDGSRRIFNQKPEFGGSRAAQTNLGADLDFVWNDYL